MIARELTEFFAGFSPDGAPGAAAPRATEPFLSNVNACYRRACWEEIRFDDVAYTEDQAFGRAMLAARLGEGLPPAARRCCTRTTTRRSTSCAATSTSTAGCARRSGHVERVRRALDRRATCARLVAADRRWMREQGWAARAARAGRRARRVHHGGRKVFSALGSRADRLPAPVAAGDLARGPRDGAARDRRRRRRPRRRAPRRAAAARSTRRRRPRSRATGAAPLLDPVPGWRTRERLHIAVVIPPFRRGSGGHSTIFKLLTRLEEHGPHVSIWLHDPMRLHGREPAAVAARRPARVLRAARRARCSRASTHWYGADVVARHGLADRLPGAAARPRAAPAPTWSTTTSPSSSPPRRRRCGRARPTRRASTASPPARGCAT